MKITGVLVHMIVELNSETYRKRVVFENLYRVIYVVVLRLVYIMLVEALLFHINFCENLDNIEFWVQSLLSMCC